MAIPEAPQGSRKRILIVEDEFFIALELKAALVSGGFDVLGPLATAADSLDLLHHSRPDAAVLDLNLRDGTATPVALLLASMGVPFVLATARHGDDYGHDPVLAGATNLGKPTDLRQLLTVIAALVSGAAGG